MDGKIHFGNFKLIIEILVLTFDRIVFLIKEFHSERKCGCENASRKFKGALTMNSLLVLTFDAIVFFN